MRTLAVPLPSVLRTIYSLRYPNGLFAAAPWNIKTGYHRAWIRDNVYVALCLESVDPQLSIVTYHALLDVLRKHEWKIDLALERKPTLTYYYLHPRYDPVNMDEVEGQWCNKQHDAIGILLFAVGNALSRGEQIIRCADDARVLQKLIFYLDAVEYWCDSDNGIWEDDEVLHASSVGACIAGLKAISPHLFVPKVLIERGETALQMLLPAESVLRSVDLAQLSLIYPLNVVDAKTAEQILQRIEDRLVRNRGVIRHTGDWYYAKDGKEAEWPMGFAWLALIYRQRGNRPKYQFYLRKLLDCTTPEGDVPELYYGDTDIPNENTPLAWSQAMLLAAMAKE